MAKTDSGGIQCPKEFYEFILHRFDRLDEEMGDLAKSVETLNLQMAESVARRDATQKLVSRMAWFITTVVAISSAVAGVASAFR